MVRLEVMLSLFAMTIAILAHQSYAAQSEDEKIEAGSAQFWVYIGISIGLVLVAGVMSGLTVGLFSLDPMKLALLKQNKDSSSEDKERAARVAPILRSHHRLLVTLLIANAAAMEALPIFLDRLVPSYVAILISVTAVLMFGEIIPQALCTDDPLKIGAQFVPLIKVFMFLLFPLAWPIAKLLDFLLGHEGSHFLFRRSELEALVELHAKSRSAHGNLSIDEVVILKGTLSLQRKTVSDCLTPIDDVFMLGSDAVLDRDTIADIMASGHSRIPMYHGSRHNIHGLILVKRLVPIIPSDCRAVADFAVRKPIVVPPQFRMFDMLNEFQTGKSHMALVTDNVREVRNCLRSHEDVPKYVRLIGVITLEDVLEELIQEEIVDETDELIRSSLHAEVRNQLVIHKAKLKFKALARRAKRRVRERHERPLVEETSSVPLASSDTPRGHQYSLLVDADDEEDDEKLSMM